MAIDLGNLARPLSAQRARITAIDEPGAQPRIGDELRELAKHLDSIKEAHANMRGVLFGELNPVGEASGETFSAMDQHVSYLRGQAAQLADEAHGIAARL